MGGRNHPHMVYLFKQVRVYHIGFGILGTPKHPIKSQHLALHLFDAGLRFWDAAPAVSGWVSRHGPCDDVTPNEWTTRSRDEWTHPRPEQNGRQFSHQGSWVDELGRQSDVLRYDTGHIGSRVFKTVKGGFW